MLSAAPVCCKDYSEFPARQITSPVDTVITIDHNSPVFEFSGGKSHFVMLRLPEADSRIAMEITSYFNFGGTFDPSIMVLNREFQQVHHVSGKDIEFLPPGAFTPARKSTLLALDPKGRGDTYVVIYTTTESLTGRSISKEASTTTTTAGAFIVSTSGRSETGHKTTGRIYLKTYGL